MAWTISPHITSQQESVLQCQVAQNFRLLAPFPLPVNGRVQEIICVSGVSTDVDGVQLVCFENLQIISESLKTNY